MAFDQSIALFNSSFICVSVFICGSISVFASVATAKKSRRAVHPRVWWLGWKRSAALHDGATGGDERRHIASARHRGSEGAPAISLNPLRAALAG
jgi:hypothetical protein